MKRTGVGVAAAVAAGLLARVAGRLVWHYHDVDSNSFIELATQLAAGGGLDTPGLRYWPPLFPGLAALLAALPGVTAPLAISAVAVLSGALLAVPAAALGRHLGGERAGLMAAWTAALLPPLVMVAHRDISESLGLLCLFSAAALAVGTSARPPGTLPVLARGAAVGGLLALAFLTRFELLLGLPALGWLLWQRPRRRLALAGLALGFVLMHLPYQVMLHQLGEGWLLPATRLQSNIAETMSGGQLSFGFGEPGELVVPRGQLEELRPIEKRVAELRHSLAQLPRAVPPALWLAALVGVRLLRVRDVLAVLMLSLPCLASMAVVDHETRYWLTLTMALVPIGAVGLDRLWAYRHWSLVALLPVGLLAIPWAVFPDGPIPVLGPGEGLLGSLLDPKTTLQATEGVLVLLSRPLLGVVFVAGAVLAVTMRRATAVGRLHSLGPLALALAAVASALLVHHLEHARASLPPGRRLDANLSIEGAVPRDARVAACRSIDAYVTEGIWVPPPRRDADAYLAVRDVEFLVTDDADDRCDVLRAWAVEAEKSRRALLIVADGPLRVYRLATARHRPGEPPPGPRPPPPKLQPG